MLKTKQFQIFFRFFFQKTFSQKKTPETVVLTAINAVRQLKQLAKVQQYRKHSRQTQVEAIRRRATIPQAQQAKLVKEGTKDWKLFAKIQHHHKHGRQTQAEAIRRHATIPQTQQARKSYRPKANYRKSSKQSTFT